MKRLLQSLWRRITGRTAPAAAPVGSERHPAPIAQPGPPIAPAELERHSPAPTKPGRPASRPVPRGERTIIVGVDFGTSSTKVIWQDLSDNHFEIFRVGCTRRWLAPIAVDIGDSDSWYRDSLRRAGGRCARGRHPADLGQALRAVSEQPVYLSLWKLRGAARHGASARTGKRLSGQHLRLSVPGARIP